MLDEFMHLFMVNRGIVMTPFHNMALMCPYSVEEDVTKHTKIFEQAMQLMQHVYIKPGKLWLFVHFKIIWTF